MSSRPSSSRLWTIESTSTLFSLGVFVVSARWFTKKERQRRALGLWGANPKYITDNTIAPITNDQQLAALQQQSSSSPSRTNNHPDAIIGSRGVLAMETSRASYLEDFMYCLHVRCSILFICLFVYSVYSNTFISKLITDLTFCSSILYFYCMVQNACDPIRNPAGHIGMCVAENKLVLDVLAERLMQIGTATAAFSDSTVYCYNSFLGLPVARDAVAYFLAKRFLFHGGYPHPPNQQQSHLNNHNNNNTSTPPMATTELEPSVALQHIQPHHVALASGCAAVLHYLFFILGEAGDCCLIPAPYYAAFDSHMKSLAGIIPFGFQMANATLGPTENDLNLAFIEAMSKGLTPKFILLTNPNNPLGVIYKPRVLRDTIEWARKRNIHTIVDEIHALSTHYHEGAPTTTAAAVTTATAVASSRRDFQNPHHMLHNLGSNNMDSLDNMGFQSVVKVLNNQLGNYVHMVWGLSKGFGASGLRVGVLYSQNEMFMKALLASNVSIFSCVSGPIQYVISELLTDDAFIDRFLEESRERLRRSYEICVLKLEEMVVPYVPAEAGLFVYVDFSSLLPQKTFAWEQKLGELLFQHARVVLTPGETQQERTPGMFRICYAWVSPEVLEIAMERLSRLIGKIRRMDWSDLNERTLGGIL